MKKKNFKNYIAFTLTEMTMVLLIMSIIAAVSAPLVKHAASDVVSNSEVSTIESPWKKISSLQGIFYSSVGNGIVSIGNIPSGSAVNYDYPAMMIQSNGKDYAGDLAQIGFYGNSNEDSHEISLDRYNNILVGKYLTSGIEGYDNINIGRYGISYYNKNSNGNNNVYIGDLLSNSYYDNSIAIGKILQGCQKGTYGAVAIATAGYMNSYSITIGRGAGSSSMLNDDIAKNIHIGNWAGIDSYSNNYISIGYEAGYYNRSHNLNRLEQNVNLGTYAGAILNKPTGFITYDNVSIGKYAGLRTGVGATHDNVAIGLQSLGTTSMVTNSASGGTLLNVAIGSYVRAGSSDNQSKESVYIGSYAGKADSISALKSIGIGVYAGANAHATLENEIAMGYYAGYGRNSGSASISIGHYAGYENAGNNSLYIGSYAGYKSKALTGIGTYACAFATSTKSFCLGNFSPDTVNGGNYVKDYEMLLYSGTASTFHGNGYITLAAKNVYAPGAVKVISSDARSKRNIILAPYGIEDFRKFDIYNFSLKYDKDHLKHIGVIAQEYRKAFPLAIVKGKKYLSIQPDWLYYSMVNAIKDLDKLVQEFQSKLDEYVNNFESIKFRIATLEQNVAKEKQINADMRKELEQVNAKLNAKK